MCLSVCLTVDPAHAFLFCLCVAPFLFTISMIKIVLACFLVKINTRCTVKRTCTTSVVLEASTDVPMQVYALEITTTKAL